MKNFLEIFSSGGGTQSTAIAALIVQGRLPRPDLVVIADTGRECSETWRYLDVVVRPPLMSKGIEIHLIGHEWSSIPEHRKDYLSHNGNTLLIGAWTNQTGQCGKFSTFCSAKWKVEAIDRYLSHEHQIKRSGFRKWIGYSLDEWRRAQRIMVSKDGRKGLIRLPLVNDIPMTRQQAIDEVIRIGWPLPPRSRCWMCPNQADAEWVDLKTNYPDEFRRAVDFEKEIQSFDPLCWLHKSCVPLASVNFQVESSISDSGLYCDSGTCFI